METSGLEFSVFSVPPLHVSFAPIHYNHQNISCAAVYKEQQGDIIVSLFNCPFLLAVDYAGPNVVSHNSSHHIQRV